MPQHVLILDPESAGADLVRELQKRNVAVVSWWQSVPFVLDDPSSDTAPDADLVRLVDSNEFDFIVAGSESGVSAAEWLAARRGLPASDPAFIHHRRDKDAMVARIREAGLRASRSHLVADDQELDIAVADVGLPAVVKPSSSAGSDLVRVTRTLEETRSATAEILRSTSIMKNHNRGAVVQEYLDGPQFHVNTVIVDGEHWVTEVYSNLFRDVDGAPQLYAGRTHDLRYPHIMEIVSYTLSCMDALGVRHGATHSEVRVTRSGPTLVEFNGRLMGPAQPTDYFVGAQGFSQATVLADALSGRTAEAHASMSGSRQTLGFYMLSAESSGVLEMIDVDSVRSLASFSEISNVPAVGTFVATENRVTTAELGLIFLAHSEPAQVDADISELTRREREGRIHTVRPLARPELPERHPPSVRDSVCLGHDAGPEPRGSGRRVRGARRAD